ncbi:hypothetical protein HNQ96_005037 [Aminobacter lissarensis]|uniref:Stress-response A/B barrel domain-containing protein n=1 Tax=Aminobacter carboxidus TaxID=376165 RepID=A0A8E2BEJ9_9HYPH|nr:Dabb family protein [Aminobacter lissarensis]MBB6469148.1 hypothetical protein [Aminobacter lissarensis]
MGHHSNQTRPSGERIKHIVMWNVAGSNDSEKQAAAAIVKAKFESLRSVIPGLLHLEIGVDFSQVDYACDIVLYSEFDSKETLAAYATHPAHLRVRDDLEGMRIARHQVDYVPEEIIR